MEFELLADSIKQINDKASSAAKSAVNQLMTLRNWAIGYYIVEYEQDGSDRAEYGSHLLKNLEKQIATELPDILLIDINLGGLTDEDGLMLTQHLLERFPDQKIVILSGYNLPVYRKEAKRIGARGFISKDVEPDELLHILLPI